MLILPLLCAGAFAQASLDVSAGAVLNNQGGTQEFFYQIGGKYRLDKFAVGLDVFGDPSRNNPKQLTRGTAFASFQFLDQGDWNFSVGAGGFKQGNEVGGFGLVGMSFKDFQAWGRYGEQDFVEAEAFYPVLKTERLSVGPFFHFNRMENVQRLSRGGIRLTLR